MHTCTQRIEFDSGHRVLGHKGKCRHLHGHRYAAEITCYATKLDNLGMVVDFAKIKEVMGSWINSRLDHNLILHVDDPISKVWNESYGLDPGERLCLRELKAEVFAGKAPYIMQDNPTAENLAILIYSKSAEFLRGEGISVSRVRVYETPNCWADYPGPPKEDKSNG